MGHWENRVGRQRHPDSGGATRDQVASLDA